MCFEGPWRLSLLLEWACIVTVPTSNGLCCTIMLPSSVLGLICFKRENKKQWWSTWPPRGERDLSVTCTVCLHFLWDLSFVRRGWGLPTKYRRNRCFLEPSGQCHAWQCSWRGVQQPRHCSGLDVEKGESCCCSSAALTHVFHSKIQRSSYFW